MSRGMRVRVPLCAPHAPLVQLVEHRTFNAGVRSSSLRRRTIIYKLKVGVPGFTQTPQLLVYNLFLRPLFIHRSLDLRLYLLFPILSHGEENNEHYKEDRGEENRQRTGEYIYEKTVTVDACKGDAAAEVQLYHVAEHDSYDNGRTGDIEALEYCADDAEDNGRNELKHGVVERIGAEHTAQAP